MGSAGRGAGCGGARRAWGAARGTARGGAIGRDRHFTGGIPTPPDPPEPSAGVRWGRPWPRRGSGQRRASCAGARGGEEMPERARGGPSGGLGTSTEGLSASSDPLGASAGMRCGRLAPMPDSVSARGRAVARLRDHPTAGTPRSRGAAPGGCEDHSGGVRPHRRPDRSRGDTGRPWRTVEPEPSTRSSVARPRGARSCMPACAGGAEKEVKRRGRGRGRGREQSERRTVHPKRRAHGGPLPLEGLERHVQLWNRSRETRAPGLSN